MLASITYPKSREYRAASLNEPINFYIDALLESKHFDLLLGYFSSAAINVLSIGFAKFICSGGKMRLIINHILSTKDKELLQHSATIDLNSQKFFSLDDYEQLKKSLDDYGKHFFDCLAYLIACNRIAIKVIKPRNQKGIAHYKSGVFASDVDKVKFKASCNFTAYGLLENLEELDIKCSWDNAQSLEAIEEYQAYFNEIFEERASFVEYVPFSEIEEAIVRDFGNKNVEELLVNEEELAKKKMAVFQNNPQVKRAIATNLQQIKKFKLAPRFPYVQGARAYQKEAYDSWVNNNYCGIFAMATGTGKTITALNCLLNEYHKTGFYQAVILVPTTALVNQWEKEVALFNIPKNKIITVSSNYKWQQTLGRLTAELSWDNSDFVIICTYASFYRTKFQSYFKKLPKETLFIADEAHNIGYPKVLEKLPLVHLTKRLALSATPKRIYDEEGSTAMETFFKDKEPYTYSFSMEKAIDEGILCKYYYYPHLVKLLPAEYAEYVEITKKLAKMMNSKDAEQKKMMEMLLLKRKRIIHKAQNKLPIAIEIFKKHLATHHSLQYAFVYVPEGYSTVFEEIEEEDDTQQGEHLVLQYTNAIQMLNSKLRVFPYLGITPNKEELLQQFSKGEVHVLTSMKCLDEGVDIPRAELAIFCSSTGNPRQFIQRRGRILRKHPDKHLATIHDLVVIPDYVSMENEDTYNLERSLVQKELERVAHFAFMSINRFDALDAFQEVCDYYRLNLHTIHQNLLNT
ncbi:MAG: DEAD/DEAH box helicase family protein [Sphingobacteriales bacterium]|nr:DEAD/DEAH box helicase family protein [Sphingobacteriales bacterium]